ncbi:MULTISPECIES: hypothetical protein [unclassified Sphingomonas]|uniref:hypothetical protein n=1 Tax=unclassified Sphingomonas TaxID=196159 RepID=UPI000701F528|nr:MULTISPECIES: hypothetical protein [unclassified Sphingomonas]KQM57221.1 hypothetical protein ASE65_12900 [Sphingomonas sp. Leaf16]KQN10396.1 hypothetical protein ASE81_12945 [Sphingomonas sp. Leaf29]KQN18196.1 hypothetical protein ASE83_12880 [Sphingomonas sp. Leaf32]
MQHIRIDTDHAQAIDLSDLKRTLALVAAGMDARFVRAGSTLSTAIETIDRIITSIEGVTGALDESVAGIAVSSLKSVAGQLDALPAVQAGREADMARISAASRVLRDHVMDMRQALRVLHIYGMNIKIAASGEAAFVGFVNDMGHRLAAGEEHLEGFLAKLKELSGSVGSVQQAGRLLAAEARKILPAVPQRLTRDADALHTHLGDVASMARQVAEIARTVQGRVATMLGALQVGDSTRQRLEHVVSALQLLDAAGRGLPEAVHNEVAAVVHRLLAALLETSAADFDRDAALLVHTLKALQPDTAALLDLIEDDAGRNGRPFLIQIEEAVGEVAVITVQLQEADQRSGAMLGLINETVDELTGRLEQLQRVQFNVQDIATNTRLLCRRHGDLGKAVSVVAGEVDIYAHSLGNAMRGIGQPIRELSDVNALLAAKRGTEGEGDMGAKLSQALVVIREGCQRTDMAVREGGDDARQLIELLAIAGDEIGAELQLGATMRQAAIVLSATPPVITPSDDAAVALAELLPRIFALYTMAQERDVHTANVPAGFAVASAVVEEDEDDDGLF